MYPAPRKIGRQGKLFLQVIEGPPIKTKDGKLIPHRLGRWINKSRNYKNEYARLPRRLR